MDCGVCIKSFAEKVSYMGFKKFSHLLLARNTYACTVNTHYCKDVFVQEKLQHLHHCKYCYRKQCHFDGIETI